MDGRRLPGWRWMLFLGVSIAAVGASWVALRSMGPAFVAEVSWSLATGPGTPEVGAEAYRRILVQDGDLREALGLAEGGPPSEGGAASPEARRELFVGLGEAELVTVRLRASERTPWAAAFAAWEAARTLEAWDRRAASDVAASLIAEVDVAVELLTEQIRIRQVVAPPASGAALDADLAEREALVGFRDRSIAMAADGPRGLLRRVGTIGVSLAPGSSPFAVAAALLMAVASGGLVVLAVGGVVGAGRSSRAPRSSRRLLATMHGAEPDHAARVRHAISDIADAIRARRGGGSPQIIMFTSPIASVGKARIACLVAEELSRRAQRTLLVDAVLHAPAIAERYRILPVASDDAEAGRAASTLEWLERPQEGHLVTSVRHGGTTLDVIVQHQPVWLAPGTAGLLFDGAREALHRWSRYQVVVIDAPALDADRGTDWLAPYATGIVIVASGRPSDRSWLKASKAHSRRFGQQMVGVVALLDDDAKRDPPDRTG